MLLSYLLLGKSLKLYKAVCGILLYLGVTCVVQPTFLFGAVWSISMSRTFPRSCYSVSYAIKNQLLASKAPY